MSAPAASPSLAMRARLRRWREPGWLRALDVALADFIHDLDPAAPPELLLATALVARLDGQGHGGLPLDALAEPDAALAALLGWPDEALAELRAALDGRPVGAAACRQAWAACAAVALDDGAGVAPLVLSDGLLQLRRTVADERRVADGIAARLAPDAPDAAETAVAGSAPIDVPAARRLLDRLFPVPAGSSAGASADAGPGPDWQKIACALALRGRLTVVTGGPGTGKTYTAARILVALQQLHGGAQPLRVGLAAPTGKAAARLRQAIAEALVQLQASPAEAGGAAATELARGSVQLPPARTLHALLGVRPGTHRFVHDAAHPLPLDLLVVDEASMVHLALMGRLLEALPRHARLVLLGDKDQLASVEAGAVLADLCAGAGQGGVAGGYRAATAAAIERLSGETLPAEALGDGPARAQQTVVLRRSRRFQGPIGQLAQAVNAGDGTRALQLLRGVAATPGAAPDGGERALLTPAEASAVAALAVTGRAAAGGAAAGYAPYVQLLRQRPADPAAFADWVRALLRRFDGLRVLCALRQGPWGAAGLNAAIEQALADAGGLPARRGEWYEGRPIMVTRNDPTLGVFNGDIGVVLRAPGDADVAGGGPGLRAWFLAGETLHAVAVGRLADVETAFAMTVHKSQGSEFGHVVLVLPPDDAPVLTRELVYTGITRARLALTLVAPAPDLLGRAVARRTQRVGGLARRLG